MMQLNITFTDGSFEPVMCEDFSIRDGVLRVTVNSITREYRSFPLTNVKEYAWRT